MTPSRKPVALVTGDKGIGFEVARAIAKSGYVVLLGARNPTTGREAAGMLTSDHLDVRFVELDVTRMETISAAAARIEADFGKLDVLVNNAGIADSRDGPPSRVSIDSWSACCERTFWARGSDAGVLPLLRNRMSVGSVTSRAISVDHQAWRRDWKYANVKVLDTARRRRR